MRLLARLLAAEGHRATRTVTSPAASTTRRRPGSRPSPSRRSARSTSRTPTPSSAPGRIQIKEERSDLVKHHLWVLWTDYFKPPHFEKYPQLHQLFNEATKLAGAAGTKGSTDVATADELLAKIEDISKIFWETKQG